MENKPYSVNYFGSHPDENNDDCWSGYDFATREEAEACFLEEVTIPGCFDCTAWIVLDGPDVHKERKNPDFKPSRDDDRDFDDEWKREMATQAAMAFGVQGWNDYYG